MTYNIQYGHEGVDSVIAVLEAEHPDIVGLQEVDVHWSERSNFADQAKRIAERLGMEYRYAPIYRFPSQDLSVPPREFGVALLSRHPIVASENHNITRLSTQDESAGPQQLPGFLEVTVNVVGTRVRVFNVHLDFRRDPAVRTSQVADMLDIIGDTGSPTLLMGDLNAHPNAPELQPLFRKMRDTWPYSRGPGFTSPAKNPGGKIDYVLSSRHFEVRDARVPIVYASDHYPVVVDLDLSRSAR